jgi:HEPN superfamily AbiU2-like protein
MTGAELEQRNIETMGENLGRQYSALFREFTTLNLYWKEFMELFGTNEKRIDRLNRAAPGFFRMLQEQQFETNMLHISRLTDSPKSVGKDNLTISKLPDLVSDVGLKQELATLIEEAKQRTTFCRDWRNRQFAHHDLLLATQDGRAVPLQSASREKVNAALAAIADVLNAIERHYYRGSCDFGAIAAREGAATLLFTLGFGVKAREKMEAKIAARKFDELDQPESI